MSDKPRPRYCPECDSEMNVLAPAPSMDPKINNWRHECLDCQRVYLEDELSETPRDA